MTEPKKDAAPPKCPAPEDCDPQEEMRKLLLWVSPAAFRDDFRDRCPLEPGDWIPGAGDDAADWE